MHACTPITLGLVESSLMKLFHVVCCKAGMIIWVQLLGACLPPKILQDKVTSKIQCDFGQFRFGSKIGKAGDQHCARSRSATRIC